MAMATRRALHFVFKVGNRFQTARFFRDVLGMKVQTGPRGAGARGWVTGAAEPPWPGETNGCVVISASARVSDLSPGLPASPVRFSASGSVACRGWVGDL